MVLRQLIVELVDRGHVVEEGGGTKALEVGYRRVVLPHVCSFMLLIVKTMKNPDDASNYLVCTSGLKEPDDAEYYASTRHQRLALSEYGNAHGAWHHSRNLTRPRMKTSAAPETSVLVLPPSHSVEETEQQMVLVVEMNGFSEEHM